LVRWGGKKKGSINQEFSESILGRSRIFVEDVHYMFKFVNHCPETFSDEFLIFSIAVV
jgi:hypothetical protein